MKHFSIIHFFLFILMLVAYHCSHAQDYVVPLRGDTIKGSVRPNGIGVTQRVQVTPATGKKTSYGIVEVREFRYRNETYRPVKGLNGYVFMKVLKDGYLTLYGFQQENQSNYDGRFLVKKDGSSTEVPNLTFKKSLTKFLSDCPDVTAKIDNGELGKRDLDAVVDAYNNCITGNTQSVAIETKKLDPLASLEQKINTKASFEGKNDALEMISEIKKKVQNKEKIPNFMIEGLKRALATEADLAEDLKNAITQLTN